MFKISDMVGELDVCFIQSLRNVIINLIFPIFIRIKATKMAIKMNSKQQQGKNTAELLWNTATPHNLYNISFC